MFCEHCSKEHDGSYGSGRFCSNRCARAFSTTSKREIINDTVRQKMAGRTLSKDTKSKISRLGNKHTEASIQKISESTKGKKKGPMTDEHKLKISQSVRRSNEESGRIIPQSIIGVSKRTMTKIFVRLGIGCSRCGWKEAVCDVHHIDGRKVEDPDAHGNLTYLCPNCHRLAGIGKISKSELVTLVDQVGDKWKEYYYG